MKKIKDYDTVYRRGGSFNQYLYVPELYLKENKEILKYFINKFPNFLTDYFHLAQL